MTSNRLKLNAEKTQFIWLCSSFYTASVSRLPLSVGGSTVFPQDLRSTDTREQFKRSLGGVDWRLLTYLLICKLFVKLCVFPVQLIYATFFTGCGYHRGWIIRLPRLHTKLDGLIHQSTWHHWSSTTSHRELCDHLINHCCLNLLLLWHFLTRLLL